MHPAPHDLATLALAASPEFPPHGRWTPLAYSREQRGAAAGSIAISIRENAFMLTAEERAVLAAELLREHSTDRARFQLFGESV